jgi:uncharacterized protein with HEPN domain
MLSRRSRDRLLDIIEDAERIARFIGGMSLSDFIAEERTIFAVERLLQRITEAAVQVDAEDIAKFGPTFPIAQMNALGNRLRHEYRYVDRRIVFDLARVEVPALAAEIEILLAVEDDR